VAEGWALTWRTTWRLQTCPVGLRAKLHTVLSRGDTTAGTVGFTACLPASFFLYRDISVVPPVFRSFAPAVGSFVRRGPRKDAFSGGIVVPGQYYCYHQLPGRYAHSGSVFVPAHLCSLFTQTFNLVIPVCVMRSNGRSKAEFTTARPETSQEKGVRDAQRPPDPGFITPPSLHVPNVRSRDSPHIPMMLGS
jgi:hypothetical protein